MKASRRDWFTAYVCCAIGAVMLGLAVWSFANFGWLMARSGCEVVLLPLVSTVLGILLSALGLLFLRDCILGRMRDVS